MVVVVARQPYLQLEEVVGGLSMTQEAKHAYRAWKGVIVEPFTAAVVRNSDTRFTTISMAATLPWDATYARYTCG